MMETQDTSSDYRSDGYNIRRIRRKKGLNQDILADRASMSQQTVSRYEQMQIIDDETLAKFAKAMNVSVDYIKEYKDEPFTVIFENNNTIETNTGHANIGNFIRDDNSIYNYNPIEKIVELFEKLLETEREKIILLEKLLREREK